MHEVKLATQVLSRNILGRPVSTAARSVRVERTAYPLIPVAKFIASGILFFA